MARPLPSVPGARLTEVAVLGIRHHGPGSARAVAAALDRMTPDVVLVEGPQELEPLAELLADRSATPPVAALVYARDDVTRAAFYPFAVFSPEYVAVTYALAADIELGFMDLPAANMLAWPDSESDEHAEIRTDPIARLSEAAGFADPERWWEDVLEHRHPGAEIFSAVTGAMAALRESEPDSRLTLVREAAMRKRIRAALKRGAGRVAVICGAWHAPVLDPAGFPSVKSDNELLAGLEKVRVAATLVPWTSSRLALRSGYGAGVASPAWYRHLFVTPSEDTVPSWMTRVARLLRSGGYDCSPAAVLEATRLAETLAAVRQRPVAGIHELDDAAVAVLCEGSRMRLSAVAEDLYVGTEMGSIPDGAPAVPLARDVDATIRRLRLVKTAEANVVDLDLRKQSHLERSHLFHRLAILGIHWAEPGLGGRSLGTFKETWVLEWKPEFEISVIEAAAHGATVGVASAAVLAGAAETADLSRLVELIEHGMLADLPDAVVGALDAVRRRAATLDDLGSLMRAVEPLAHISRYGDVRRQGDQATLEVVAGLVTRVAIGLPAACASLDDDAAADMFDQVASVHRGVALVEDRETVDQWLGAVSSLAGMRSLHGLVAGYATRLLLDAGWIERDEAFAAVSRSLSRGADPGRGAMWLDGFLTGDAMLLLHDPGLLAAIDEWLTDVSDGVFDDLLPLVRRAFSRYTAAERRMIGAEVKRLEHGAGRQSLVTDDIDSVRGDLVLPTVALLLGSGDE